MARRWLMAGMIWAAAAAGAAQAQAQAQAPAPGPDPVAAARATFQTALAQATLTLPVALFVQERPAGYGIYQPRATTTFAPGEPMFVYLEPQGYKYKDAGGDVTFGMTMDFTVLGQDGTVLGGKEHFLDVAVRSHHRNTEWMLPASITIQNAPPGEYQLELTVHDASSADVARARLPFTIAPAAK